MKPLYLFCREKTILALDGPSLLVWSRRRVLRRIPLRQVSRIVASGNALLQTSAVCACLEHGISVTYTDGQGPRGWVAPFRNDGLGLAGRLERFCDRPDAASLYENWKLAQQRKEILSVLRSLNLRVTDLRGPSVEARLSALLREGEARRFLGLANAVLASRLAEFLTKEGCGAAFGGAAARLRLIEGFAGLLVWRRFGEWILESPAARSAEERTVIAWMEARSDDDAERVRRLADAFLIWLGHQP